MIMTPFNADNPRQRWVIEGDFIVNHNEEGKVLDIEGSEKKNGAETVAFERHGGDNQRWEIEYTAEL